MKLHFPLNGPTDATDEQICSRPGGKRPARSKGALAPRPRGPSAPAPRVGHPGRRRLPRAEGPETHRAPTPGGQWTGGGCRGGREGLCPPGLCPPGNRAVLRPPSLCVLTERSLVPLGLKSPMGPRWPRDVAPTPELCIAFSDPPHVRPASHRRLTSVRMRSSSPRGGPLPPSPTSGSHRPGCPSSSFSLSL